jgi:AcrR family transcriptional regulator
MGTAERIERERLEKRARILDAARELFVERGVEAVTLREIAQRIEYSTTAIYVHFKDKAALVEAMVQDDFAAFAANLEAAAKIPDPIDRLRVLHESYIEFALTMPRHYTLLFLTVGTKEAANRQHTEPAGIEGYRVLHATIDEAIRLRRFRADITDVDATAQIVWASVHGLVSLLIVHGHHGQFRWSSREVLTRASYEMVLRGLLRDPDEITAKGKRRRK